MEEIIVPINLDPKLKTYANSAFEYSVIETGHISLNNWFITQLTQLGYNYDNENSHSIFIVSSHFFDIPLLETQLIERKETLGKKNFFDCINNSLNEGFCCITELNEYYINDRNAYENINYDHINMIYGVSHENETYHIIGFDKNRKFKATVIEKENLYKAYKKVIYPSNIFKIKPSERPYDINWWKVLHDLRDYLDSGMSQVAYKRDNYLFGLDVMRKIKIILEDIRIGKYFADLRVLSIIQEHKKIFKTKLSCLLEEGVSFGENDVLEVLQQNCINIDVCVKLFIRFTIKREDFLIDRIIDRINLIIENEEKILPIIIKGIEEYIKNNNINAEIKQQVKLKVPYKSEKCGGVVFTKYDEACDLAFSGTLEWDVEKIYINLSILDTKFPLADGNLVKMSLLIKTRSYPIIIYLRTFLDIYDDKHSNMRYEAVVEGYGNIEDLCDFHTSGISKIGYNQFFALPWKPTYYQPDPGDKIYFNCFIYSENMETSLVQHEDCHAGARFLDYIELELER